MAYLQRLEEHARIINGVAAMNRRELQAAGKSLGINNKDSPFYVSLNEKSETIRFALYDFYAANFGTELAQQREANAALLAAYNAETVEVVAETVEVVAETVEVVAETVEVVAETVEALAQPSKVATVFECFPEEMPERVSPKPTNVGAQVALAQHIPIKSPGALRPGSTKPSRAVKCNRVKNKNPHHFARCVWPPQRLPIKKRPFLCLHDKRNSLEIGGFFCPENIALYIAMNGAYKLRKLRSNLKKYEVETPTGMRIRFGDSNYSDYTKHHDSERKRLYLLRHMRGQDWNDPTTPGFWARWILWNKKTIREAVSATSRRFGIKILLVK